MTTNTTTAKQPNAALSERNAEELLREADDLLGVAWAAISNLGLRGRGSDCSLSHEVRMFALKFSPEERSGPGALQVQGNGAFVKWRRAVRALKSAAPALPEPAAAQEPVDQQLTPSGAVLTDAVIRDLYSKSMRELVVELETDTRVTRRSATSGTLRKLSEDIHKFRFARAIAAHLAAQPLAEVSAAQAVPGMSKDRITAIATEMAVNVAKNASVAPQLCFPHIYLGLTELFAAAPVAQPTDTTREA